MSWRKALSNDRKRKKAPPSPIPSRKKESGIQDDLGINFYERKQGRSRIDQRKKLNYNADLTMPRPT